MNCRYKKYKLHEFASFSNLGVLGWHISYTTKILEAQPGTFWGEEVLTRMGTI